MSDSIGGALRHARELRGLSVAQVSETTRIRSRYIQALESDDLSAMSSAAQARGFLKIYADFLGLKIEKLVPPPAPAPTEETPTAPAHRSETGPEAEPKPAGPNLLTQLRDRLSALRAARAKSVESAVDAEAAPAAQTAGKKKAS